jgi:hypothetical protein
MKVERWFVQYWLCVRLLHAWGERAWPWNVRFVWAYVEQEYMSK